jgi:hypothetical protein
MRLGAIHRPQPLAVRPLSRRASLHLMTPPPSADWHAKCPADGDALSNDKYGCCVPVADYRILQMRKANLWGDPTKPLVSEILARYPALTGFSVATGQPDNGTDTAADMQSWCTKGIRIGDQTEDVPYWCMVNPHDQNEVNLAIAHTGPVAITMLLPIAAQDLDAWSQAPGAGTDWVPGSWGAHRVMSGKYSANVRTVRTWGVDVAVHPDFWSAYVVAVDATISHEWLTTTGLTPLGLDFDALKTDMTDIRLTPG